MVRADVLSSMRRLFDSALGHDLRLCPTCRRPFVAPREILASHEDGNHVAMPRYRHLLTSLDPVELGREGLTSDACTDG